MAHTILCSPGARGPLCGSCGPEHYFNAIEHTCSKCSSSRKNSIIVVVSVAGFAFIATFTIFVFLKSGRQLPRLLKHLMSAFVNVDKISLSGTWRIAYVTFQVLSVDLSVLHVSSYH